MKLDEIIRRHGLRIFAGYTLLAAIFTYPLLFQFSSHAVGGKGDAQIFLWNLWWIKHAVMELHVNPLFTDHILFPYRSNLSLHTLTLLNGLISIPLQYIIGLPATFNLLYFLSFVVTAYGMYLLAMHFTDNWRASFVAGVVFAFCPFKFAHLMHANLVMTYMIPFFVLYLIKAFQSDGNNLKYPVIAGILFGLNYLVSVFYGVFTAMFTVLFILFHISTDYRKTLLWIKRASVVFISSLPFILPHLYFTLQGGSSEVKSLGLHAGACKYVVDLFGFFSPPSWNVLFGGLSFSHLFVGGTVENIAYMGIGTFIIAAFGWIKTPLKNKNALFWKLGFIVFTLLSMGPFLHVFGRVTGIVLPFNLFIGVPFLEELRTPARFFLMSMLCVSLLAAYGLVYLMKRYRNAWIIVLAFITIDYAAFPILMTDASIPPAYNRIAEDYEARVVLDLPYFVRSGIGETGHVFMPQMYYQTMHQKRIMSGFLARFPNNSNMFYNFLNLPFIRSLYLYQNNLPLIQKYVPIEQELSPLVVDLLGIDYIVINRRDTPLREGDISTFIDVSKIYEDHDYIVLKTNAGRNNHTEHIEFGDESSIPYLFRGWINGQLSGSFNYALSRGKKSHVIIKLRPGHGHEIKIRAAAIKQIGEAEIAVGLNDIPVGTVSVSDTLQDIVIDIPGSLVTESLNRLTLEYSDTIELITNHRRLDNPGLVSEYLYIIESANLDRNQVQMIKGFHDYMKNASGRPLDWEQENLKFRNSELSILVDYIDIYAVR
jgi:hypothetical protein